MTQKSWIAVTACILAAGGLLLLFLLFGKSRSGAEGESTYEPNASALAPADYGPLIDALLGTTLLNGRAIHDQLGLTDGSASGNPADFLTHSPYAPQYRENYVSPNLLRYPLPPDSLSFELDGATSTFLFFGQEPVLQWYSALDSNSDVCGVAFADSSRVEYWMRTFPAPDSAHKAGYVITHHNHCGTCSSLRNLAAYLKHPDLTSPARSCARRLTLGGVKACLMEKVGFEERCAETWAYNALHTRRRCGATCVRHYGLWNVLINKMSDRHTDEFGRLNPCLACDEQASGPGFQYTAGRTRRNSGIVSAIRRLPEDIYVVDHERYFQ